jgi:hypothetical protein
MMSKLYLAIFVTLVLAPLAGAAARDNPAVFTDPANDVAGVPDITRTTVGNTASGTIQFLIEFANRTTLGAGDGLALFMDADRNTSTGDPELPGIDHVIVANAGGAALARWNGSTFGLVTAPSLSAAAANGMSISISAADLGNTTGFVFVVVTRVDSPPDAPLDIGGPFEYVLAPPQVDSVSATFSAAAPRAGKVFRLANVTVLLKTQERVPPTKYTCAATLAGKRIKGTGTGACSWRLAKTARGKRLVVTLTVSYGDARVSRRFTFTVR